MESVHYPICVLQNASWKLQGTYKDPDGNTVNLTAFAGDFVVRRNVASPQAILRIDTDSGNIVLDNSAENNVTVTLSATETDELPTKNMQIEDWVYEFRIWETADPENTTVRLMEGPFRVSPSAAREDNT